MDIAKTKAEIDVLLAEGELDVVKNIAKGGRVCYNFTCVVMKFFCELRLNFSDSCRAVYDTMKQTAIFNAEGISAPLSRKINDHISNLHLLKAQSALAENEKVSYYFQQCLHVMLPLVIKSNSHLELFSL